jgi:hypothetical protein
MELVASLDAPCPPDTLFGWVDDLSRYPQWLTIVTRADALEADQPDAAWLVDLRGHIGPLARSKRLRMVRTTHDAGRAVFERQEADGRRHAAWVLTAEVTAQSAGSRLDMRLHYGGSLWGPVIERLLRDEIEASKPRLLRLSGAQPA